MHDIAADKERLSYVAKNQAEHIITKINCVMSRTNTLKIMAIEHNSDTSWFDKLAEDLYVSVQHETGITLKNFAIAPNGVVSNVYPLNGNKVLVGFDFLDTRLMGNLEAKEAYEKNITILTNPFELVQGGVGLAGRSSVIIRKDGTETFWGLVTVTVDFDNFMDVIGLKNLHGMGVDYSLSYIDADGNARFMQGVRNLTGSKIKTTFDVRNLKWQLELKPAEGWFSVWNVALAMLIIMMLSCFAGIITFMVLRLQECNEVLLHLSLTDVMTGCYNRRAYEERIREISLNKQVKDLVYVSADVNGLKHANDTLGHAAGDELISGVALCLQRGFGLYGDVFRIGGDEFVALIHANEETLQEILKNVNSLVREWRGHAIDTLSLSIGCASHLEYPDSSVQELCKIADKKMYVAKKEFYQKKSSEA
jgi:diguanylate cyclase (GGDEF)-like protein